MDLGSLLGRHMNPQSDPAPQQPERDFDQVCGKLPHEELGQGVAEAGADAGQHGQPPARLSVPHARPIRRPAATPGSPTLR